MKIFKQIYYFGLSFFLTFTGCISTIENSNNAKLIVGIPGLELSDEVRDKLCELKPDGIILMGRNIDTTDQVKTLTSNLKKLLGENLEISIDCEGGFVNIIKFIDMNINSLISGKKEINTKTYIPSAKYFGDLYQVDKNAAVFEMNEAFDALSKKLAELGVTHNFAPVVDLNCEFLKKSNRAFSDDAKIVIELAKIAISSMLKNGINPVLKHAPGLQTLNADTHEKISISYATREDLEEGLYIFKALCDYIRGFKQAPRVMVNHGIYKGLGSEKSASTDSIVFKFLKEYLGNDIIIICDDLDMDGVTKDSLNDLETIESNGIYKLFCHSLVQSSKTKNLYLSKEGIVNSGCN